MADEEKDHASSEASKTEVDKILKEMLDKKEEKPPLESLKTILSAADSQAKGEEVVVNPPSPVPAEKKMAQPIFESSDVSRLEKIISEFRSQKAKSPA